MFQAILTNAGDTPHQVQGYKQWATR